MCEEHAEFFGKTALDYSSHRLNNANGDTKVIHVSRLLYKYCHYICMNTNVFVLYSPLSWSHGVIICSGVSAVSCLKF